MRHSLFEIANIEFYLFISNNLKKIILQM